LPQYTYLSVLDVRSFRATDIDRYLVVARVIKRLAVNKQRSHRFHMESFSLKTINEVEGEEKYHIEVSNRFRTSEELVTEVEINSAWEMIKEHIKI
jgi:hypothetical protein